MKTFLTVALGVFVGLTLFAGVAYFIYSNQVKQAEAEELALQKESDKKTALLLAQTDSILNDLKDSLPTHNWQEVEEVDPITNERGIIIGVPANSDDPLTAPLLTIACAKNRTSMFVNWQTFIGSHLMTTTKLDDVVYNETGWERSNDYSSSRYPGSPIPIIKKMLEAERYVVRGRNMDGNTFTAVFELEGIDEAIPPIRQHCKW